MKLQNHKSLTIELSKPFMSSHPAFLKVVFTYMDDMPKWGPRVRPLSPSSTCCLSPRHSSLLSLHCHLGCSSSPADPMMSSGARPRFFPTASLSLGTAALAVPILGAAPPLGITMASCLCCFSVEFEPRMSLLVPQRSSRHLF